MSDHVRYVMDIQARFTGRAPAGPENRAAPEATPITRLMVETVREALEKAGYTDVTMGYGSMRADLPPRPGAAFAFDAVLKGET